MFTRVHNFANSRGQDAFAIQIAREVIEDYQSENLNTAEAAEEFYGQVSLYMNLLANSPDLVEYRSEYGVSRIEGVDPAWEAIMDIMIDAAIEWIGNAVGGAEIDELKRQLNDLGWNNASEIGFKALRTISKFVFKKNPYYNAYNSGRKAKELYDKLIPAYRVIKKMASIDVGLIAKIGRIIKGRTGNKLLNHIEWVNSTVGGKIKGINAIDFWDDLVRSFGAGTRAGNQNEIWS